jgi:hypothetical protein
VEPKVKRYVIQYTGTSWDKPFRGQYVKLGGGCTSDLQEAQVIGWKSVKDRGGRWVRYIEAGRYKAIPVIITPVIITEVK